MIFLLFIALLFPGQTWAGPAFGADGYEKVEFVTYFGTTDKPVGMEWDAGEGATAYEIRLWHVEKQVYVTEGSTTETWAMVFLPRSGHFIAELRSVNEETGQASEWVTSIEIGTVDGVDWPWWLYGYLAPPGPIIIN